VEGNVKKAILKRTADALEKIAIGSILVGLFQGQQIGVIIGVGCIVVSYFFTAWEAKS
jgi:hypothetical protein